MIVRGTAGWSALAIAACTTGAPDATPSPSAKAPSEAKTPAKVDAKHAGGAGGCEALIAEYLAARAELATCERDSDCAEMWPGLCPHGPYYVDREGDVAPVLARELGITKACSIPDCEPPMELGIAHCEAGRCAKGRAAPVSNDRTSCWDFRETNLEADGSTDAETVAKIMATTPHVVISPAQAGTLVLELDWPESCTDCKLQISEHNSGMAHPKSPAGTSTDAERNGEKVRHQRIELPVTPGPYHLIATSTSPVRYLLRAQLKTATGQLGTVTRHGIGWQRMCED